ncbi:pPIWI_RE_Z domain-containing protein [Kitasatospora sp. NPDC003701]
MRSLTSPLRELVGELQQFAGERMRGPAAEFFCQIELGLYLQQRLMPDAPAAHAWVLFSGYGFAKAHLTDLPKDAERTLRVARYSLWGLGRSRAWREALEHYQRIDPALRGYEVPDTERPSAQCEIEIGRERWQVFDGLLRTAPPLAGSQQKVAGPGRFGFPVSRAMAVVELPEVPRSPLVAHDVDLGPAGGGERLTFRMADLRRTAAEMDAIHARVGSGKAPGWERRLRSFELSTPELGTFLAADEFTVDGIQHLLGIVGAGKSTLRDVIAVHLARLGKRTTVAVPDVAEVLKLVELYNLYTDGAAAPVLGANGRERHAQGLHRRWAGRGEQRLLAHDDPAFAYLGTSCLLNTKLSGPSGEPLAFGEAPCSRLRPPALSKRGPKRSPRSQWQKQTLACPYWSVCPRHHASRSLVDALIWVATLPSLIDSAPPRPQNGERIRYLELACRRSDLVIVDEADRVQMHLDQTFAPAVLLATHDQRGFIDWLNGHKIRELAAGGRTQLSDRDVAVFCGVLNTAVAATDKLHAMLVAQYRLRQWVRFGFFSAWTLQLGLLDARYPLGEGDGAEQFGQPSREALGDLFDAFRDNPFGDRTRHTEKDFADLTALLNELLNTGNPERTRELLLEVMEDRFQLDERFRTRQQEQYEERVAKWQEEAAEYRRRNRNRKKATDGPPPPQTPEQWYEDLADRFEFTLLLSALERRLAVINTMWPRVEAALSLSFNDMYRRPFDYGPMVPESPMGNVLGFQFRVPGEDGEGVRSGDLVFFRCSGVGRELLRVMPTLPSVDGRPGAHVLLMSGSSWAGRSSRYHIAVPVGVIIEPEQTVMERISDESEMRFEFVEDGDERMRISGTAPEDRPAKMRRLVTWLGAGADEAENGGPLEQELLSLPAGRDQILLLVGSYEEARVVADTLHNLNPRWRDRVLCLVSDNQEIDEDDETPFAHRARVLRRGDVEHLKDLKADVLVAPLLAVERGHNILNDDAVAAIGTVYFLARPNPHPDDLSLAVHAVNDWIVRAQEDGDFARWVAAGATIEAGAEEVRRRARSCWYRLLRRSTAWSCLGDDREQITWDILVLMWQVIGRLVRGGVPARVVLVDAAFAPGRAANPPSADSPETSLLYSILDVLDPYFEDDARPEDEQYIARALYAPLRSMLGRCLAQPLLAA